MSTSFNVRATLRAARRRTVIPVLGLCFGLLAAQPVTQFLPETYEASASVVITATGYDPTTRAKVTDPALAQNLAPTVAQLAQSREVALDTATAVGLPSDAVLGHLTGVYQQGMQIITVKATASSGGRAAAIANAATAAVGRQFGRLQIGVGGDITTKLLDRASAPDRPRSPNPELDDALGAFAGLLAGLGLIRLSRRVDDRLRGPARLGAELGLPVLGILPRVPRRYARHNARTLYTRRSVSEAMAATVAALSVFTASLPCRRLLVTSVRDDDGKALGSALLALALAEGADRVTLIEGHPRRPAIGGHFPEAAACTLQKAVVDGAPPPLPGSATLSVVVADRRQKRSEPQPEPVDGARIGELVDAVAGGGDIAVVHAPPVLAGAELATLSRHGDGVVLVVQTGVTRRDEALRAAMLIRRMNLPVVGVLAIDMAGDAAGERYRGDEPAALRAAPVPSASLPVAALPVAPASVAPASVAPASVAPAPAAPAAVVAPVAAERGRGPVGPPAGPHAEADGEPSSASRAAPGATSPPATARAVAAPVPASLSAVRTLVAPPVQVHPAPIHPAASRPGSVALRPAAATPAAGTPGPGGPGPEGLEPGAFGSGALGAGPAGPDVRDGGDEERGAKHRRRDRVDALSAPFEAVLTETEEFTSPLAGAADLIPERSGDGEPCVGGWAVADPSWPPADRQVPDSRQRPETYQPKEFA